MTLIVSLRIRRVLESQLQPIRDASVARVNKQLFKRTLEAAWWNTDLAPKLLTWKWNITAQSSFSTAIAVGILLSLLLVYVHPICREY